MTRRILVVEDSPTQAAALVAELVAAGYETRHAADGAQGLAVVESESFDLVISDIVMPGAIDGYELCRRIKAESGAPVLLLTSLSDPMDIIHGLECGADNFLTKPYDVDELLARIDTLLRLQASRRLERFSMGVKILFMGKEFVVTAEREQILDMLVTTFEEAVKQNRELREREEQLEEARADLARYAESLEARLDRLADSVPEVLYSLALDGEGPAYASRAAHDIFGIPPHEFSLDRWSEHLHPDDREAVLAEIREAMVTKSRRSLAYRYLPPARDMTRWIEQTVIPVRDDSGQIERLDGIARDITESLESARMLKEQEERYRSLAVATSQIVWTTDAQGAVVEALPTWQEYTGQPLDDILGDGWLNAIHPDDRKRVSEIWRRAVEAQSDYGVEYRIRRHDGDYRWFAVRGVPVSSQGEIREWIGTCADIHERRRAEDELRSSEERFHTIFDASPLGITVVASDGVILDVNPAFTELLGYTANEAIGRRSADLGLWLDNTDRDAFFARVEAHNVTSHPTRVRNRAKDGSIRTFLASITSISLSGETRFLTMFQDVSALTEAENAVRTHVDHLGLLQTVTAAVAEIDDLVDALVFAMKEVGHRTRWDAGHAFILDEEGGLKPIDQWYWGASGVLEGLHSATLGCELEVGTGMVGLAAETGELQWLGRLDDESTFWRAGNGAGLGVRSGVAVPIRVRDRTVAVLELFSRERREHDLQLAEILHQIGTQLGRVAERQQAHEAQRRNEAKVRQAQKMDAVGRLAGGVAHDFNNVLTAILTEVQLLRMDRELDGDEELASALDLIEESGQRAAALTKQLLTFSRREIAEPQVLDAREVVVGLEKMMKRLIGEHVRLAVVGSDSQGRVRIDRGHLEQVIVNLVVNARDAMPAGGDLRIEVQDVELDELVTAGFANARPGQYVLVAVSDTGTGMSAEVQTKLFEPFFTTKEEGRGTGLGLATSYGIVEEAGGFIGVYSELGHGTTMKVYLPHVDAGVSRGRRGKMHGLPRGSETILVVEDEPNVRSVAVRTLEALGYKVLVAENGEEALEALGSTPSVGLVFTDLIMPGMTGGELGEHVREFDPTLPVLYTTGYTDDMAIRAKLTTDELEILTKPYTTESLATKVRELLDEVER